MMIDRNNIILMIEQRDTAVADAQRQIDLILKLLAESDDVTAVAAAQQLKAAVMDGIMVQSGGLKDMTFIYEIAKKTKEENDTLLEQDICFWKKRLHRALIFDRVWKTCLDGFSQSILQQRYKERKTIKEIIWNGYPVTKYSVNKVCDDGISELQRRMAADGFFE